MCFCMSKRVSIVSDRKLPIYLACSLLCFRKMFFFYFHSFFCFLFFNSGKDDCICNCILASMNSKQFGHLDELK